MKKTKQKPLKTFHIVHDETALIIDTEFTSIHTLEFLIFAIFRHFRDKKPEKLDRLVRHINVVYENLKFAEAWKKDRGY